MPLPLAAPVATGVATAAASTGARSTLSNIFTGAVGGIARAFGFGQSNQPSNSNVQENTAALSQQESSDRVGLTAARTTSYSRPSDTVETISRMGSVLNNNNTRERQDTGERLSGSGSVISLLSSIDKNIQALTSYVFSTGGFGGGRGSSSREVEVGRRSSLSPGAQADINGLIAAAALSAVGQVISNGAGAFQRGAENRQQANEQASQNRNQLSERQQAGASPGQVMAGNQARNYTISNEELADIQEMLETPEEGEDSTGRLLRESINNQLTTLMSRETVGSGGVNLTPEIIQYLEGRVSRNREREQRNTTGTEPVTVEERPYEVSPTGSEGIEQILRDLEQARSNENNALPERGTGERESLPLREREPRAAAQPSAFSRALSSAVPRFSLSGAVDVITGRNLNRSRAASAIDNEYTSTNINPVVETPMNQQAPTIINNNNIIQGGGQSQPSMSAETGTPSMPAGSGVPPMIGIAPTPPSSPAFYSYSN